MLPEQISKFIETEQLNDTAVKIEFKKRNNITGIFIKVADFDELRAKNFWRIVTEANFEHWRKTNSIDAARIFNGSEFTRLSVLKKKTA